jgi:two-component system cell cycle sensor histidine kinase/response regulator CckA
MTECKNILIVDDEAAIRMLLCHALQRSGFTPLEAASGDEALAVAEGHRETIVALVSDIVMPGMSGPELARNLEHAQPGIKVVLMSGYTEQLQCIEPGWEFLQKPFSPAVLCDILERLCGVRGVNHATPH